MLKHEAIKVHEEMPTFPVIVVHLEDPAGTGLAACSGIPFRTPNGFSTTPRFLCPGCVRPFARTADPGGLREAATAIATRSIPRGTTAQGVRRWALAICDEFLTPEATAPTDSLLRSSGIVDAIHRGVEALHKPGKCGDSEPLTPEATAPEACDVCLSFGHLSCDGCGHCLVRARERLRALTPEATAPDLEP